MAEFHFDVEYIPRKKNIIANFLSRNPLWDSKMGQGPLVTYEFGKTVPIQAQVHAAQVIDKFEDRILSDPLLNDMRDAGSIDDSYVAAISALREGKTKSDITALPTDNLCR